MSSARIFYDLEKHGCQPPAEADGAERRLRYGTLDSPDDPNELVKQRQPEYICSVRERTEHAKSVNPQHNNNGHRVNYVHRLSSRSFLLAIAGCRSGATEIQSEQFHAGQQRMQTFLDCTRIEFET